MNTALWALAPAAALLVITATAVAVVALALKGTNSRDRASVLLAVAEVLRAIRGRR